MPYSKELSPAIHLSVYNGNDEDAENVRVDITKYKIDPQNGAKTPIDFKFISMRPKQYAVLRSVMDDFKDEIKKRIATPNNLGRPVKRHLGGNMHATLPEDYNLVDIRQYYYKQEKEEDKSSSSYDADSESSNDAGDGAAPSSPAGFGFGSSASFSNPTPGFYLTPAVKRKIDSICVPSSMAWDSGRKKVKRSISNKYRPMVSYSEFREKLPTKQGVSLSFQSFYALAFRMEELDNIFFALESASPCEHETEDAQIACFLCNPQN